AQLIDDAGGRTMASASTVQLGSPGKNLSAAVAVGKAIAERAQAVGVSKVVFDRGGFLYHGRIRALAEAVREAGVKF
ncbi:MAG: 50S ribosomal protein L18, partial [Candidatus Dormibacteraceae bacterium]